MPGGRPPKLTEEERAEVYAAFEAYIRKEEDPTIVGFAAWDDTAIKYDITDDNINDWQEFSGLRRRAVMKQEAFLIKNSGNGNYHATVGIFRLKQPQHGYTDKQEIDQNTRHSGSVAVVPNQEAADKYAEFLKGQ